ncbi:MAG: bifunctional nuclease domain-containing protein [Bacteroidota bacterium]
MEKIKLDIVGLSYSQTQSGAYALVLGEAGGKRRLPIIIGGFEAQAIAIELEKMTPSRPLTHDLFKAFCQRFKVEVKEIVIYNLVEGIFYAKIVCQGDDKSVEIDARTSDAIALAVRFGCPIYTFEFILSSAGIILDEEQEKNLQEEEGESDEEIPAEKVSKKETDLAKMAIADLEKQLNEALDNEDYEKASRLRDELNKRKKSS